MKKIFRQLMSWLVSIIPSQRITNIIMWPIATRLLGQNYNEIIVLKRGFKMHAYLGDQLGRLVLFSGNRQEYVWEPVTTQLLERLCHETKHVIIAGSHVGLLVLHARQAMPVGSVIYTFEPVHELYSTAQKNFALNQSRGPIKLYHNALSDTEGGEVGIVSDTLRSHVVNNQEQGSEVVLTRTLDSFVQTEQIPKVDILLLDVEGFEQTVLRGFKKTLEENPPDHIIFEVSPRIKGGIAEAKTIVDWLTQFGYQHYIVDDDYELHGQEKKALTEALVDFNEHVERYQKRRYFNVLATKKDAQWLQTVTG